MTARERIENYRNGTQQSGGLTARERIENYRQENGLSAEPAAAETVQTAAEPVQASSAAAKAQAEYKAASDLLKSTPGGLEAVMKYQAGGYGAPTERGVNFYDRAPDIGRGLQQLQQEAQEQLRETVPVADYMKYQRGYRVQLPSPGRNGPVGPYAAPAQTGSPFDVGSRDMGLELAETTMTSLAQQRIAALNSEIEKYKDYQRAYSTEYDPDSAARSEEYGARIKALESERDGLAKRYGLEPRAADWGGVLGHSSMRGISSFDLNIAKTLDLLGYGVQKGLMLGDLTHEQWEEMGMPTTALKHRLQSEYDRSDRLTAEAAGDDKSAQFVGNLITGTVAAVPQAALAFFTAGASLGTTAGLNAASSAASGGLGTTIYNSVSAMAQNPSFWMSFVQTAGNSFEDAKADGAGDLASMSYAIINGLLNAGVEVSGGIEQLPARVRGGGAPLRQWIDSALDEGKEEIIQGIIERGLQSFVYGKANPLFSVSNPDAVLNPLTSLEEGGMGALIGLLLGGGQMAVQSGMDARNARLSAAGGAQGAFDMQAGTNIAAAANAAQRPTESLQAGTDIAAAAQASTGTARPAGQQNAAPGAGAASAGGIQANNSANAGAGNSLRENAAQEGYSGGTSDSLRSFIENTRSMDEQERARQHTDLDTQTTRAQETAEQLTGVATDGSRIGGSAVTYIDSRYGANGTANHSMESIDDFSRMGYVLDNFTDVRLLNADELDAGAAKLIREFGGSAVRFSMPVDGGNYIVEAVPDSNTKKLSVVSAYMSSAAEGNVQQNGAAEAGSALPSPAGSTLENLRDGENGWGTHYRMAAEALEAGMKELAPGLWREYSGEEYTPERDAIVLAILRVSRDVDNGSVSLAKALRYLERAYKSGGMEAIERIGAADGTYAPRAGETVTLPTAEQELDGRNGGKLNGQKQTETDSTGRERTETDGGNQISDRGGGRDADKRSGGKAGVVERSGAGRADAGRKAIERQNRGRRLPLERVTSRELGLKWGTENPNVRLLPAEAWDEGLRQTAERLERETGCGVTYVLGGMEIEDPDGETHTVRGVITPEQILIQADCMSATAEQIGDHELFHYYADNNPGLISSVREKITEKYGREEFDEIVGKYIERLRGIIDVSDSPFADAQDSVLEDIENEIFADAYAGINVFGAHAERYQGEVRAATERRGVTGRQTREATERRTGPPAGEDEYLQLLREQLRSGEITDSEYDRLFDEYYQGGSEGRYSYAGEKARGADLEALKRAKEMQSEGVANDVIRRETGWYAGMDGKWRFEIDDSGMEFRRDGDARLMQEPGYRRLKELTDKWGEGVSGGAELTEAEEAELERLQEKYSDAVWEEKYMLTDFLKHDALFEAYPKLRGVSLAFDSLDGGTKGYFRKRDNTIVLSDTLFGKDADTLIHEIQHVIQSIEGFSPGASPEYWNRRMEEGYSKRGDSGEEMMPSELYRNTAGEIEARDAAGRRSLTAAERRERMPDLGDEDTVFADGSGESYSINNTRGLTVHEQMKKYRAGEMTSHDEFYYGESPSPLDTAGFDGRPLVMSQKDFRKSRSEKHNVPPRAMTRLTEALSDPVLSFEAGDKIGVLTKDIDGDGKPLLVGVLKNTELDGEIVNRIKSAYGLDDPQAWIKNQIAEGKTLRIYDNEKADSFLGEFGYKAERPKDYRSGDTIPNVHENVKYSAFNEEVARQLAGEAPGKTKFSAEDEGGGRGEHSTGGPGIRFSVSDEEGGEKKKERAVIAQQELHRTLNTMFSIPAGTKAEMNAIVDGFAAKAVRDGSLTQDDMTALFDRLYNSGVMEVAADEYRQAARSAVEKKRIYVPEDVKHEFGDDWNGFRRQAFAAGVYLTNSEGDYGIDVLNQELATSLPGIFDPDETDMRLILERVVQAAEEGKAQKMSLAEYTAMLAEQEYVSESEVLDTLERQLDWAMRTFAEKARIEVTLRERADSKRASERIRKAREREAGKVRRERERGWENSRRQRERELESRAKERAKRREIIERQRKQKELRELQQKTLKQLQWLSKNRYRAPAELQKAFDDVLSDIDIYAAGAADSARLSKKYGMTWQELADIYKQAEKNDKNFFPSKELKQIVARLDNRKIKDMDIDALTDLYKAAVGLRTELYNRNNVIMDELHRTFAEIYTDSKAEIKSADLDNGKTKLFNSMQLSPMNMLQRAAGWNPDSTFYSMAKQLEKGERDIRAYTVKAERMLEDFLNEHREWVERADGQGKDAIWYELTVPELLELKMGDKPIFGETFKVYMTPSQKVHMYLESKNYENLRHMAGGRTFPDKKTYSEGKRKEAFEKGRTIKLAPETVRKIVSSLTPEEMELAGVLERYYNDFAKGEINRVSNALYGYDKAVSKNYAPIYTNKSYVQSTPGVYNATAEGVGNLKAREYSKNPSYNIGAFDAFEKHIEQTARFVGMAIPARNWTTLMNWRDGSTSMRDTINHEWTGGSDYIDDLLAELQGNGGVQKDEISTFADKVFGNYIAAVFGANPSIVFKQLGSIPLGGVWLGFNNLPSPAQVKRIDTKLIARYTQELAWRTLGYAMPETKFLKEHPNWTQTNKFTRFAFGGGAITAMDGWAASVLWPWAENKVRKEHPELSLGTQEEIDSGASPFYREVAKVFDEAVARSQSTSDIMHQGTLRRSKNDVARAVTMFKSDSSQSFNALRQRLGEAKYYKKAGDKKKYREALGGLAAALLAVLGGNLWAEAVNFLMNLWKHGGKSYRDDDGELTPGSMAGEMTVGLIGDMAGLTAGGEELVDWLDGALDNGIWLIPRIEVFGLEQINDFAEAVIKQGNSGLKALKGAADVVKNGGDPIEYLHRHAGDIAGGIKDLAKLIATYVPALPVNNLEAYMLGTVRWVSPELAAAYEDIFKTATKDRLKGLTGGALEERVGSIFDVRSINASEGAAREAARLYEAGFTMAVPSDTPGSISVGGEERKLEAYQKQVYDQVWAGSVGEALNELVQLDAYENAGDAEREKMFKAVYDYAADKAKAVVFEDYTPQKTAEGADAVIAAGGTAAQWGAWRGMAAGLEDSAQEYKLLKSLDYSDKVKLAIAGSIMGTEMETDGGAPSQYAKMLEAVGLGLDMNSYIELREAKAVDKFLDAANAGASIETAKNAALKLSALEPEEGKKSVSDTQKWRAAVDAGGTTEEQMNALKAVMREEQYTKLEIALSYGIEPESYVHLKELLPQYDKDGSGGISNEELEKAIDTMGGGLLPSVGRLTIEQQAVLWQLFSGSKSAKNNPYSSAVGQKILDAREKGEEKDLSALMG